MPRPSVTITPSNPKESLSISVKMRGSKVPGRPTLSDNCGKDIWAVIILWTPPSIAAEKGISSTESNLA